MRKYFNTAGACRPNIHYMVNIDSRLSKIKTMIDCGEYFTINRARQYGKTTTIKALIQYLQDDYFVLSLDFQQLSYEDFENEDSFVKALSRHILKKVRFKKRQIPSMLEKLQQIIDESNQNIGLSVLFEYFSDWCNDSEKPIVLIIDEVDSATNNQVFLDFLSFLRGYYLDREEIPTFQSVILAGVYDVKNLKQKIRPDDRPRTNSPWNIATDFLIDMSFSAPEIATMLLEYENDYCTGMNIASMSQLIYEYTSGYPFLVSRICKLMDERIVGTESFFDRNSVWTKEGFLKAIRLLLAEENTLFESLDNKLIDYPQLKQILCSLLLRGKRIEYIPGNEGIRMSIMFGFVVVNEGILNISNRIFETRLYNGFLAERTLTNEISQIAAIEKNQFVQNGILDMDLVIHKFVEHYTDIFANKEETFLEDDGRSIFLLYLRPIINGTGNYYIESRTRNNKRTDIIVDYNGKQAIIELKIWHGMEYNNRGEEQLSEYLEYYHLKKGYMISFNFNKNKQVGVKKIVLGDKVLIEAVV